MTSRKVTDSQKKRIAARQEFRCANSLQTVIDNYICPFTNKVFDESGYDVDHINELVNSGDNSLDNLQALCINCHRVKTIRFNSQRQRIPKEKKPKPDQKLVTNEPPPLPEFNVFIIKQQLLDGFDQISFTNYRSWQNIENWAMNTVSTLYSDSQLHQLVNLLNRLQNVRSFYEPRKTFDGRLFQKSISGKVSFEIGAEINNAVQCAQHSQQGQKVILELLQLLPKS